MGENAAIQSNYNELKPIKLKIYSLILFITSYANGLLIPVLSLVLLSKGLTLSSLSAVLGLYALTVVILEVPTGIAADILGRKKIFVLSLIICAVSFSILFFGQGIVVLSISLIFYGISRALSSGSFDALFIDWYIETFGQDKLSKISTRLNVLEALGLALGSLTGGILPAISENLFPNAGIYNLNIIVRVSLTLISILISAAFISDTLSSKKSERISLKKHIENCSSTIKGNKTLIYIFLSVLSTGIFLSSLETYWQPYFKSLLSDDSLLWLLGILSFLYLAAAVFGSIAADKVMNKLKWDIAKIYFTFRLLLVLSLAILSLNSNVASFITFYALTYLIFGMSNIPESVIINSETPKDIRASVLSVKSLIFQAGALLGSFMNSIIINYFSIPNIWMMAAMMMLITLLIVFKNYKFK